MKRKVNLAGPTTLTVSLPSKWAKQHGIKKGDEIEVIEDGSKLTIYSSPITIKKEVTVSIPTLKDYLNIDIYTPYLKGYDTIKVKYNDLEVYEKILQASKIMMGFEIVENTSNSCKLMNISTKLEQNFDILLNRLFMSGVTFGKELLSRLSSDNSNILGLLEYENNANKLSLFCRRAIHTGGANMLDYSQPSLYSLVGHLEEEIDCFKQIVETVGKSKIHLNSNTQELFKLCIAALEINFKIFSRNIKSDSSQQSNLFIEHKRIRDKTKNELAYFKGDVMNSYISSKLKEVIEISHHINEELLC